MSDDKPVTPDDPSAVQAAEAALDRLAQRLTPPSIGAQIRRLLPKIETAVQAGATHEQIVHTLQETGIDVSLNTFRSALYRARKKAARDSRKERYAGGGSADDEGTSGPTTTACAAMAPEGPHRTRDPLAVPEKPRAFDWDPTERPNITFINEDEDASSS
jgi:hypothetical protein